MAFLQLSGTDIIDITEAGDVEISHEQQMVIARSKYGHAQFKYINGSLVQDNDFIALREIQIERYKMNVTRFQALAAMHGAGILTQVQAVMADPLTDPIVKLAWENALEFKRLSPTVIQLAQLLGLTDEQLDSLFTTAKGIEA